MANIAYLLMVHKDPAQVKRLVESVVESGDVYIHVDKKSEIAPFKKLLDSNAHVFFLDNRIRVNWAAWSMTVVYLELLLAAFNCDKQYDRFVFLTGQDYPLMTNQEIIAEFDAHSDVEYIMAYNIVTSTVPTDQNKIRKRWFFENPFNRPLPRRIWASVMYRFVTKPFSRRHITVPLGGKQVDPYFGQMLSAFTREGAKLLLDVYQNDAEYNKVMKHVHASVEHYWQTVIFNSPLRVKTIQGGAEHEITDHFGWAPLHYHTYIDDCSIYTEKDYDELICCGYMFFRKVVPGQSDSLMDRIDKWRYEKQSIKE